MSLKTLLARTAPKPAAPTQPAPTDATPTNTMPTKNILSGMGCVRDQALRDAPPGSRHDRTRSFMSGSRERVLLPLDPTAKHESIGSGDLCSLHGKYVGLFDATLPFAGVIGAIGEDHRGYVASVFTRSSFLAKIDGLRADTPRGSLVYATNDQSFTLDATQGLLVGQLLFIEKAENSTGIIEVVKGGSPLVHPHGARLL